MVALWAAAAPLGLDSTAIAFLVLGVFLATGVITLADIGAQGDVLATFIWFAVLFTLGSQLNELGFMVRRQNWPARWRPGVADGRSRARLLAYVLLHYLFVSQTAHLLALFGVFLDVGVKLGVNPALLAFQLLFATNYFSTITPQGSSSNCFCRQRLSVAGRLCTGSARSRTRIQRVDLLRARHGLALAGRPLS